MPKPIIQQAINLIAAQSVQQAFAKRPTRKPRNQIEEAVSSFTIHSVDMAKVRELAKAFGKPIQRVLDLTLRRISEKHDILLSNWDAATAGCYDFVTDKVPRT